MKDESVAAGDVYPRAMVAPLYVIKRGGPLISIDDVVNEKPRREKKLKLGLHLRRRLRDFSR